MQTVIQRGRNHYLGEQHRANEKKYASVNNKTDSVKPAGTAKPNFPGKECLKSGWKGLFPDQGQPEHGNDKGAGQITGKQPFFGIGKLPDYIILEKFQ